MDVSIKSFEDLKHRKDEDLPVLPDSFTRGHRDSPLDPVVVHEVEVKQKDPVKPLSHNDVKLDLGLPTAPSSGEYNLQEELRKLGFK